LVIACARAAVLGSNKQGATLLNWFTSHDFTYVWVLPAALCGSKQGASSYLPNFDLNRSCFKNVSLALF